MKGVQFWSILTWKMPRGKLLSEFEKGYILEARKDCLSNKDIADGIQRSIGAVQNFVNRPRCCKRREVSRNLCKLSDAQLVHWLKRPEKVFASHGGSSWVFNWLSHYAVFNIFYRNSPHSSIERCPRFRACRKKQEWPPIVVEVPHQ